MVANNHKPLPLPYWAPALWRVPMPLQFVNEAYARPRGWVGTKADGLIVVHFEWVGRSCVPLRSRCARRFVVERAGDARHQSRRETG
jgi:hypothetical protein